MGEYLEPGALGSKPIVTALSVLEQYTLQTAIINVGRGRSRISGRGVQIYKGGSFSYINLTFLKFLHENEII